MNLELNPKKVTTYMDDGNVILHEVDLGEIVGQIEINELLEAIKAADQFSAMAEFVTKELRGEDE